MVASSEGRSRGAVAPLARHRLLGRGDRPVGIGPPRGGAAPVRPPFGADPARAATAAGVLKVVAHPLRLRIIALLLEGEAHVTSLASRLGAGQPIVSQQLKILRDHGLVAAERESGFALYRLVEPSLEGLVRCMEGCAR